MFKKLLIKSVLLASVIYLLASSAFAGGLPSWHYGYDLNKLVIDPSVVNSAKPPFEIDVPYGSRYFTIGDGYLYYSDWESDSTVYAIDIKSRILVWSKLYTEQINQIIYDDGRIYFGAEDFYCLNAKTGEQIWTLDAGKSNNAIYKARVYLTSGDNLYGITFFNDTKFIKIIDKISGQYRVVPKLMYTQIINDFTVWNNNIYIALGSSGPSSTTNITKIDLNNYSEISTQYGCRTGACNMLIDGDNSQIILSSASAGLSSYNLHDLSATSPSRMVYANRFVKYNETLYTVYGEYFKTLSATNINGSFDREKVLNDEDFINSGPLIVNEYLFAITNSGSIWSKNLETGEIKKVQIVNDGSAGNLIYADGYIISVVSFKINDLWQSKVLFLNINDLAASPSYEISIDSPYNFNTLGQNQYLGQLHCHYVPDIPKWNQIFNGLPNPAFTVNKYSQAGYDFVALTEHNQVVPMPVIDEGAIMQIKDAEEITVGSGGSHILAIGVKEHTDQNLPMQSRIDNVFNQGGLSILAHPNSNDYPISLVELISLNDYSGVEAINGTMFYYKFLKKRLGDGSAFDKIDRLLSLKKRTIIYADDDYTPGDGGFDNAAVVVFAPSSSQADIMQALSKGDFYAVQGSGAPRIDIQRNETSITIYSDQISNIRFIGEKGKMIQNFRNVTSATYSFVGNENYVRAEITSPVNNKKAWTQPIFINSKVRYENLEAGEHTITTEDALFNINTSGDFTLKSVPVSDLPKSSPPAGYLANAYSLNTSGEVLNGNAITYSYKEINLQIDEELLRIYRYNEQLNSWEVVSSTADTKTKTITASLPHYSLYTLSAEIPEDQEQPIVALSSPTNLENISGEINIEAEASDNQAVTAVRFILNDNYIGSDITAEDGWSTQYDVSNMVSGSYKLLIEVEDFSGNVGSEEYDLNINSQLAPPAISIIAPARGDIVKDVSEITGFYRSDLEVQEITMYLDDIFINKAELKDGQFSNTIDWEQYIDGEHALKVEMIDIAGNIAIAETTVRIGDNISATIVSPSNNDYLRGTLIPLQIEVIPEAEIEIYIDGDLLEYVTEIDLLNYSLGDHIIEVKYKGEGIANTNFNIITSYQDTINIVRRLEKEGGFTNHGVPTAIVVQLRTAQMASILGYSRIEQILLRNLERFIEQQSKGKKPKIIEKSKKVLIENITYLDS